MRCGSRILAPFGSKTTKRVLSPEMIHKMIYKPGHSKSVVDFFSWAVNSAHVRFYFPLSIALRPNSMRALFLQDTSPVINRNDPIVSIPYSALLNVHILQRRPESLSHVTQESVASCVLQEEMSLLVPQLTLAAQIASISHTPSIDRMIDRDQRQELLNQGYLPWYRLIDNEPWNEQELWNMYRNGLDLFQQKSYLEMLSMFNHSVTNLHEKLELPCPLEHFKRTARVIIGRIEHLPSKEYFLRGRYRVVRFGRRLMRALWKRRRDNVPFLVPIVDLVNHSNRPNCAIRVTIPPGENEPFVTLHALNDIHPGQEICRSYNFAMQRAAAFFRFGFLPYDVITIVDNDPWKEQYVKVIAPRLQEESQEKVAERQRIEEEVERLQSVFRSSRGE